MTQAELLRKETIWESGYFEPDRWRRDLESCNCSLIGEYEPDANTLVMRFELDENFRGQYAPLSSHFHTVIMDRRKAVVKKQD